MAINRVFNHVVYYVDERNHPTAGKINRLHDWCNVSVGGISGWMPRPQRFIGIGGNTHPDGIIGDSMVDLTFDNIEVFNYSALSDRGTRLHKLCEMPIRYNRIGDGD